MSTAPLPGIQALLDSAHQAVTLAPFLGAATLAVTGVWAAVARGHIRRAWAALAERSSEPPTPSTPGCARARAARQPPDMTPLLRAVL
ncbi:hypothetical protein OG500_00465 [Kitasatospora sp. NBC_01250]|uniref:hypothetical protein n=1 Tax=Kitasatospora sp. NBC_01250 TaxID=2903571 RepID=UPI002E2EC470|nr:hypothetical protein [Kitasatospora sp. NBC_01250]